MCKKHLKKLWENIKWFLLLINMIMKAETIMPSIYVVADLVVIFGSEKNNTCKLQYYWHGWHGSIGRKVKPLFEEYVNLTNEAARLNSKADFV